MKKPNGSVEPSESEGRPEHCAISSRFESLSAYLFDLTWDDGSPRQLATLLLFSEEGRVKLFLKDRALKRGAWVTGSSLTQALESLDAQLAEDTADWKKLKEWEKGKWKK